MLRTTAKGAAPAGRRILEGPNHARGNVPGVGRTNDPGQNKTAPGPTTARGDGTPHTTRTPTTGHSRNAFIVGMRKPPSLRDQLVQARLSYSKDIPDRHQAAGRGRSVNLCNNPNCRYCPRMNKSGETISSSTGKRYITKYNVNCQSSNLIYCLRARMRDNYQARLTPVLIADK